MITFPATIKTDKDKIKFLYRTLEVLRLECGAKYVELTERKITQKEWEDYYRDYFKAKQFKIFDILNPLKEKTGLAGLNPDKYPDDPRLLYKEEGKQETKWDNNIKINEI